MEHVQLEFFMIPGYEDYIKKAQELNCVIGGITLVAPNGKYLHLPFYVDYNSLKHSPDQIKTILDAASRGVTDNVKFLVKEDICQK